MIEAFSERKNSCSCFYTCLNQINAPKGSRDLKKSSPFSLTFQVFDSFLKPGELSLLSTKRFFNEKTSGYLKVRFETINAMKVLRFNGFIASAANFRFERFWLSSSITITISFSIHAFSIITGSSLQLKIYSLEKCFDDSSWFFNSCDSGNVVPFLISTRHDSAHQLFVNLYSNEQKMKFINDFTIQQFYFRILKITGRG